MADVYVVIAKKQETGMRLLNKLKEKATMNVDGTLFQSFGSSLGR